jgi:hypothetical protein
VTHETEIPRASHVRYKGKVSRIYFRADAAFASPDVYEFLEAVRMRGWADENAEAARVVSEIDRRRKAYIEQMLVEAGVAAPLALTRAQLVYWTYLGAALSRSKLTGKQLDRIVAELKRIGLGEIAGRPAARGGRHSGRLSKR